MFLGIDIGGTKCAVILADGKGNILQKIRFATTDVNETLTKITESAKKLSEGREIVSCGVSCGGPLDEKKGIILSPPNLPGWDNIHIKELLEETLNVPCALRNDANACAVAEHLFGAGRNTENMIFMTFGTGLGAGIIMGGRLISGAKGLAGEIGHIRLADKGPVGYGKEGSFEGFCSGGGLSRLGKTVASSYIQKGSTPLWADKCDVAQMASCAREGDKAAREVFEICGEKLGQGLAVIIDMLNPEKIIIGSVYARCRDLLEKPMRRILEKEALAASLASCEITVPELGESIGDMAAIAVAMEIKRQQ